MKQPLFTEPQIQAHWADEGLDQIENKGYEAELGAAGVDVVHAYAIAFDGKTVRVQSTERRQAVRQPKAKKKAGSRKQAGLKARSSKALKKSRR